MIDGSRVLTAAGPAGSSHSRVPSIATYAYVSCRALPTWLAAPEAPSIVAVDIPIGLPERAGPGGRAAENAVRPLLGARQSSVFSVPSRAALAAADYGEACRIAFASSEPPRKVSKQLFMLVPKIREVDACLRDDAEAAGRVFEVHPEVAFWRLTENAHWASPRRSRADATTRDSPCGGGSWLRRALRLSW